MNCPNCSFELPTYVKECPVCYTDVGCPNVRASKAKEEIDALNQRFDDARISTKARNCENLLLDFGTAVLQSKAVISRSIGYVKELISSDNKLYNTFYQQIQSGSRLPEDNRWDRGRPAVDGTLFPYYGEKIIFAALSLNNFGLKSYGDYSIVLKEETIINRATVFEENSFIFCQERHKIVVGNPIPLGYRTTWTQRNILAMAKLHSKFDPSTTPDAFPTILMTQDQNSKEEDFIEVHIYGPIHSKSIERIVGSKPKKREDQVIWRSLKKSLIGNGIVLEEH